MISRLLVILACFFTANPPFLAYLREGKVIRVKTADIAASRLQPAKFYQTVGLCTMWTN